MSRGVLILALCAACGRIGFDARVDAGAIGDGALDASDGATEDSPPACSALPFAAPVPIAELNIGGATATLRLRADELYGVFWSSATGDIDLYEASRPDLATPFTSARLAMISSTAADLDPGISGDGDVIVFSSDRGGNFDLYEAVRSGGVFGAPVLVAALSTPTNEQQPNFLGNELYFMSQRTGTARLYHATRTGPAAYTTPVLIDEIADANESDPTPHANGRVLYWGSDRPGGPGNGDIYRATRMSSSDPFSAATLVPGLSTTATEGPNWISNDDCRLYVSSAISGMPQIYLAERR